MIRINNLHIQFEKELIYQDFSLAIKKGEHIAITGDSGKGKSTLLNLLAGFIPNFKGDVTIGELKLNATNIKNIRKLIAWVPQETSLYFPKVRDLLMAPFGLDINKKQKPSKEEIFDILTIFNLSEDLLEKKTKEISGGQKQRILLASAILTKKKLLLLDEPTSALDSGVKKKITDYILSLQDTTIITATHDDYWIEKSDTIVHLD